MGDLPSPGPWLNKRWLHQLPRISSSSDFRDIHCLHSPWRLFSASIPATASCSVSVIFWGTPKFRRVNFPFSHTTPAWHPSMILTSAPRYDWGPSRSRLHSKRQRIALGLWEKRFDFKLMDRFLGHTQDGGGWSFLEFQFCNIDQWQKVRTRGRVSFGGRIFRSCTTVLSCICGEGRKSRGEIKDLAMGCFFFHHITQTFFGWFEALHTSLDLDLMRRRLFILCFMPLTWKLTSSSREKRHADTHVYQPYLCVPSFHTFQLSDTEPPCPPI